MPVIVLMAGATIAISALSPLRHNDLVQRFDAAGAELVPGQRVRVRVTQQHRWGVMVEILGHEGIGASIDGAAIDSPSGTGRAWLGEYPAAGTEMDAVVQEIRRWSPPAWVRLTIRAEDLRSFQWLCDFCGTPTVLSPGGDGVVMDVRSADGPGSHAVVAHRECLRSRLHESSSEHARVDSVGRR
ncbi:hypothetical protein [Nonomuraea fuscirosea]|uniref:hypothetical protein n=1 Tax=Nonomuraea fuscirosea TaxID=1291556 RepID=UPI0033F581A9